MLLPADTMALWAGLGNNYAFTVALVADCGVTEAAEDALLDTPYLSGAVASGASGGLATWLATNTVAY